MLLRFCFNDMKTRSCTFQDFSVFSGLCQPRQQLRGLAVSGGRGRHTSVLHVSVFVCLASGVVGL